MKKKGFTLIELLAVIVILAVLALILTPMIQELILNARKSAFERTIDGILSSAEYYQIENPSNEAITFTCNGTSCEDSNGNKLTFKGEVPLSGTITISENGVVADNLCNNSFCGSGSKEALFVNVGGGSSTVTCAYGVGTEWNFDYLDETNENRIHTFFAPCNGYYKLEVWGASGGFNGGSGGYSEGYVNLTDDEMLYITVGGKGQNCDGLNGGTGGFNGGGNGGSGSPYNGGGGGGGATHIAISLIDDGQLKKYVDNKDDILIVAGGGGGGSSWSHAGAAGGYVGLSSTTGGSYNGVVVGGHSTGGTQDSGYAFGQGQNGVNRASSTCGAEGGGGGGAGWYGGYSYQNTGNYSDDSGAGGSSYIGNDHLENAKMFCYNCTEDTEHFKTYTESTTCVSNVAVSECSKQQNGYARITYIGSSLENYNPTVWSYSYKELNGDGVLQTLVVPKTGKYKLEVWGAQGGSYSKTDVGGYGGYSVGELLLTKDDTLYIAVGGAGEDITGLSGSKGGYNGGGNGGSGSPYYGGAGGGGATHIAVSLMDDGQLKNYSDNRNSIIIVAGGGGGEEAFWSHAGSGGGYIGSNSTSNGSYDGRVIGGHSTGGTQDSGYAFGQGQNGANRTPGTCGSEGGGGGGAGWYGGYSYQSTGAYSDDTGAGGSGYIAYESLRNKKMVCYNCTEDKVNESTYTESTTCAEADALPECSKKGNGYAKITYIGN